MSEVDAEPMGWPSALQSREAKLEPFEWYRRQLAAAPVHFDEERNCWDVVGYDAVTTVLTDHDRFSSVIDFEIKENDLPNMLSSDPPEHTHLREALDEFFRPDEVRPLVPDIEETARTLLEKAEATGRSDRLDVVEDFSTPLPIHVIAGLLGVPAEDREQFKEWSDAVIADDELTGLDPDDQDDERVQAAAALTEYFIGVCARRRKNPGDDLVSRMIQETDLTDEEILGMSRNLLIAGNITTTNLLTNTLWCLAEAGELGRVRENPDLIEGAIEETLRYRPPSGRAVRRATEDTELCGRQIEAEDQLVVWFGAANRDPDHFEDPGSFDLERSPNPHLSFGRGVHACLGATLARVEARVGLETFFARYDSISPIETDYEPYVGAGIYGVQQFPVAVERNGA